MQLKPMEVPLRDGMNINRPSIRSVRRQDRLRLPPSHLGMLTAIPASPCLAYQASHILNHGNTVVSG